MKTDAHLSSPTILNVELLLEAEHVIPKSFYFQRLKKDYLGSHSQCSIPVLVVVDVSQNPHGPWWIDKIRYRGVFYDLSNQGLWSREQVKVSERPNSWNHSVLHFCAIRPVVNIRIRRYKPIWILAHKPLMARFFLVKIANPFLEYSGFSRSLLGILARISWYCLILAH